MTNDHIWLNPNILERERVPEGYTAVRADSLGEKQVEWYYISALTSILSDHFASGDPS